MSESSIYVIGLPTGCDDDKLKEIFSKYGTVVSQKVLPPHSGKPGMAGIVSMETEEKAKWCVENVSGTTPEGCTEPVTVTSKSKGWKSWGEEQKVDDGALYVTGLPSTFDDDQVKEFFEKYGPVKSVKVLKAREDQTDGAAIVSMVSTEQAKTLIENVSGTAPHGLSSPLDIKAKLPSRNWNNSKGWGKGGGFGMDPWAMMQMFYMTGGKGMGGMMGGGMGGKGGFGGGYGGGKGWGASTARGLSTFPSDKKVWVGGLPEEVTFKELQDHFGGPGTAKFATVMKGKGAGTGGVAFGSVEEAASAISTLNGSELKGSKIVVDAWTRKEKTDA
jgi:RNA recognition motif-containing protein